MSGAADKNPTGEKNIALTFDEYPVGSPVSRQYGYVGVLFSNPDGGRRPFLTTDADNPTSPVLSGYPLFSGAIEGNFVDPGTTRTRTVSRFSLDVGYINDPGAVRLRVFGRSHELLGVIRANDYGMNHLVSTFKGAQSFIVRAEATEDAGFAIDNVVPMTAHRTYVALGDSYSSGEGNPPFYDGRGGCHYSPSAWPDLLANDGDDLTLLANDACSGATTDALFNTFKNQQPQLSSLDEIQSLRRVSLVTLTMGGNDIGFGPVIKDCYLHNCASDGRLAKAEQDLVDLKPTLINDFSDIASAAPNADVLVVGYPRLLPRERGHVRRHCVWMAANEQQGLNDLDQDLDAELRQAANAANVEFAPTKNVLDGHELCTADSWVHSVDAVNVQLDAHPLRKGQEAIKAAVRRALP